MIRFFPAKILMLACIPGGASAAPPLPFGAWHRASDMPVIAPRGDGWESAGTFNPAVVVRGDKIVMLYRAQDKQGTSRLGYAESADGIAFHPSRRAGFKPHGRLRKRWRSGRPAPGAIRRHLLFDLHRLQQKGRATLPRDFNRPDSLGPQRRHMPANKGNWNVKWTKSGAIIPQKIDWKILDVLL